MVKGGQSDDGQRWVIYLQKVRCQVITTGFQNILFLINCILTLSTLSFVFWVNGTQCDVYVNLCIMVIWGTTKFLRVYSYWFFTDGRAIWACTAVILLILYANQSYVPVQYNSEWTLIRLMTLQKTICYCDIIIFSFRGF